MSRVRKPSREHNYADGSIDAGIHLLEKLTPAGQTRTFEEIAQAAGCSKQNIIQCYWQAMRKLKKGLEERGIKANDAELERIFRKLDNPSFEEVQGREYTVRGDYREPNERDIIDGLQRAPEGAVVFQV